MVILVLSGIAISLKFFWGIAISSYGTFFVSYLIIVALALIFNKFKDTSINYNAVGLYILVLSILFGCQYLRVLEFKNYPLQAKYGKIYTTEMFGAPTNELIKYIQSNIKQTDEIIILPEGAMINFLTNRKTDNYYNSLIPLYVETFGEAKLIEHFKKEQPDYIIFNNWNSKDYYFKYICSDYAVAFCNYVAKNYIQEKTIGNDFRYLIFKNIKQR